jgi:hypothetical protein
VWPVSAEFLAAVPAPHDTVTTVTVTPPPTGSPVTAPGPPVTVRLESGSVTADRSQRVRRTANLTLSGGDDLYEALSRPGATVTVRHGFSWGDHTELVPMIVGELSSAAMKVGSGLISVNVADRWQRVDRSRFVSIYTPETWKPRVAVIGTAILDAIPGVTLTVLATDPGLTGTTQAWTSRSDMIAALATDSAVDAYFAPDGSFVIVDAPDLTSPPVWTLKPGPGGTIEGIDRDRPLDKLYNTVVVRPGTTDDAQTWQQVEKSITDYESPRHPAYVGVVPYFWDAPSLITVEGAQAAAAKILAGVQGTTETLTVAAVANPALDAGDVIRIDNPLPSGGTEPVVHIIDSLTVDLITGGMSVRTRSTTGDLE